MFRQWQTAKREHPDALLLFRMGDFYELFFEDATTAAPLLEIALTARGKGTATEAPMCGIPHHALNLYIHRLIERGLRVAICEQMEDPRKTKGMVRREVVRVVSPGTFTDPERLDPAAGSFMAAVSGVGPFGIALCDLSTGALRLSTAPQGAALADTLARYEVREILVAQDHAALVAAHLGASSPRPALLTPLAADRFHPALARDRALELLGARTLAGFGCPDDHPALPAVAALLAHLCATQGGRLAHLDRLTVEDPRDVLVLDAATRRNLELVANLRDASRRHTVLEAVDASRTPLGSRQVRQYLTEPLCDLGALTERLALVDELHRRSDVRRALREALGGVRDCERLLGRASLGSASPREVATLRGSLEALPAVGAALATLEAVRARSLAQRFDVLADLADLLRRGLADEPGLAPGDGRTVRALFDRELDELRELAQGGKRLIAQIETRERERTGISSLKVRYNRVFGYFIEISKSQLARVPDDYERRQTIATGERYVTPELRELESRVLSAEERLADRERELYDGLVREITARAARLRETAQVVAEIDALAGFAQVAADEGWVRPDVTGEDVVEIRDGRHPVVERLLPAGAFVPNDARLDADQRVVVVTGPNMGGKSTYLRQTALIVLLAQSGSFVPARSARVGLVDRIFCRVGAQDNLAGGESTFMVEMTETANILHNATPRSLVILDEIGRGTSTWDGMAIAWSVVEKLHDDPRIAAKTLFATHYHELTELAGVLPRLANAHIAVREDGHDIVFLHRVEPGPSDRSYGIHVARLAGIPDAVVQRAYAILERFVDEHRSPAELAGRALAPLQLPLFFTSERSAVEQETLERLRAVDLDDLSPRQAFALLAELVARSRGG